MLGQSQNQIVREATKVITQHEQARRVPLVTWAGADELPEDFGIRCARLKRGADRILAAVPYGYVVPDGVQPVFFTPALYGLLCPPYSRYRAGSGGRGSGRSQAFGTAIVLLALTKPIRVLCAREYQQSLRESVHHLLDSKISALGLGQFFEVNERSIKCITSGAEIIFTGLFQNASQLKSLEDIALCYVEEAQTVSSESLQVLLPTIRAPGSELWFSWNPDAPDAPVEQFANGTRADTRHVHVTFESNPWFPPELDAERLYLQRVDADAYAHVWLGQCRSASEAQVFKNKYFIEAFEPDLNLEIAYDPTKDQLARLGRHAEAEQIARREKEATWQGPIQGADWGFSQDPSVLIRCWIFQRVLYISHEAYSAGVDIDKTPALFDQVPDARKYVTRSDCARPETISYMQRHGYPKVSAAKKWKNCAEDGIAFMRSFEKIVVHPRCTHTAAEFRLYSHKINKATGEPLPDLEDKHNHTIDAIRYALQPVILAKRASRITPWDEFLRTGRF
jgi:phage terminase large subunit